MFCGSKLLASYVCQPLPYAHGSFTFHNTMRYLSNHFSPHLPPLTLSPLYSPYVTQRGLVNTTTAATFPDAGFNEDGSNNPSPKVDNHPNVVLSSPDGSSAGHFQLRWSGPMLPHSYDATPSQINGTTNESCKNYKHLVESENDVNPCTLSQRGIQRHSP